MHGVHIVPLVATVQYTPRYVEGGQACVPLSSVLAGMIGSFKECGITGVGGQGGSAHGFVAPARKRRPSASPTFPVPSTRSLEANA